MDFDNGGDFIGRKALQDIKRGGIRHKLCAIAIGGEDWLPLYGAEAVVSDGRVITRLRSCGYGHTVKKNIGLAYLPLELAEEGIPLEIEIFGKFIPAQVAPRIMYDPEGKVLTS